MGKRIRLFFIGLAFFACLPSASITVTSPRAGDSWCLGRTYAVTWTRSGAMSDRVAIRLRNDSGFNLLIDGDAANSGTYSWPLAADIPAGNYFVRVRAKDGAASGDSAAFAIAGCIRNIHPQPMIPPPALPDFEIKEIYYSYTGGEPKLAVILKNNGAIYFGGLIFGVRGGETPVRPLIEIAHGGFCPHGQEPIELNVLLDRDYLYGQSCASTYEVEFDPARRIAEFNENNNKASKTFPKIMTADGQITAVAIVNSGRVLNVPRGGVVTIRPGNVVSRSGNTVRVSFRVTLRNCGENPFQMARLLWNGGLPGGEISLFDGELASMEVRTVTCEANIAYQDQNNSPLGVYLFLQGGYEETSGLQENNYWRFAVRYVGF
jgi:hypothetical protein